MCYVRRGKQKEKEILEILKDCQMHMYISLFSSHVLSVSE